MTTTIHHSDISGSVNLSLAAKLAVALNTSTLENYEAVCKYNDAGEYVEIVVPVISGIACTDMARVRASYDYHFDGIGIKPDVIMQQLQTESEFARLVFD